MIHPLFTHEIGSLAKPNWRVKAMRNRPLTDQDLADAQEWGKFLDLETEELLEILQKRQNFTPEEKQKIVWYSSLMATRMLEKAGLDVVYDGEQHRVEMYEYPIRRIEGFQFLGHVRSFDNKYYRKAAVQAAPRLKELYHLHEYQVIESFATKPVKIPMTGAYTLVDWSFDEFYLRGVEIGTREGRRHRREARARFLHDLATQVIHPNLKALYDAGARFLQIDEPAATTKPDEIDLFFQSLVDSVGDLKGKAFFSVHICFSDYRLLFPTIQTVEGIIREFHFEYANRDTRELGVDDRKRRGYEILKELVKYDFIAGVGVLDVHTDWIEPPELVRDRVLYAVEQMGTPERVFVAPDCGLRTRTWKVAYEKLRNMVEGVELAKQALGLS